MNRFGQQQRRAVSVTSDRAMSTPPDSINRIGVASPSIEEKCTCCPYGHHIDLDFLNFLDGDKERPGVISSSLKRRQALSTSSSASSRIGVRSSPQTNKFQQNGDINPFSSLQPDSHIITQEEPNSNSNAFPRSVSHPSKLRLQSAPPNGTNITENGPLFFKPAPTNISSRSFQTTSTQQHRHLQSTSSQNMDLQSIREQMALSLKRIRELEDQVKGIPALQEELENVKEEKKGLKTLLESKDKMYRESRTRHFRQQSGSLDTRSVAVGTVDDDCAPPVIRMPRSRSQSPGISNFSYQTHKQNDRSSRSYARSRSSSTGSSDDETDFYYRQQQQQKSRDYTSPLTAKSAYSRLDYLRNMTRSVTPSALSGRGSDSDYLADASQTPPPPPPPPPRTSSFQEIHKVLKRIESDSMYSAHRNFHPSGRASADVFRSDSEYSDFDYPAPPAYDYSGIHSAERLRNDFYSGRAATLDSAFRKREPGFASSSSPAGTSPLPMLPSEISASMHERMSRDRITPLPTETVVTSSSVMANNSTEEKKTYVSSMKARTSRFTRSSSETSSTVKQDLTLHSEEEKSKFSANQSLLESMQQEAVNAAKSSSTLPPTKTTVSRHVGVTCKAPTREVGVLYVCEPPKPATRSVGVNLSMEDAIQHCFSQSLTLSQRLFLQSSSFRSHDGDILSIIQDLLRKDVHCKTTQCELFTPENLAEDAEDDRVSVGCGDDTVDVEVRPFIAQRHALVGCTPVMSNESTWTDRQINIDSSTNTPLTLPRHKATWTVPMARYSLGTNTDKVMKADSASATDQRAFMALNVFATSSTNTVPVRTKDSAVGTTDLIAVVPPSIRHVATACQTSPPRLHSTGCMTTEHLPLLPTSCPTCSSVLSLYTDGKEEAERIQNDTQLPVTEIDNLPHLVDTGSNTDVSARGEIVLCDACQAEVVPYSEDDALCDLMEGTVSIGHAQILNQTAELETSEQQMRLSSESSETSEAGAYPSSAQLGDVSVTIVPMKSASDDDLPIEELCTDNAPFIRTDEDGTQVVSLTSSISPQSSPEGDSGMDSSNENHQTTINIQLNSVSSLQTPQIVSSSPVDSLERRPLKGCLKKSPSDPGSNLNRTSNGLNENGFTRSQRSITFADEVSGLRADLESHLLLSATSSDEEEPIAPLADDDDDEGAEECSSSDSSTGSFEEASYDLTSNREAIQYSCTDDMVDDDDIMSGLQMNQTKMLPKLTDQNIRETFELSEDLLNACKVLDNHLQQQADSPHDEKTIAEVTSLISGEWFAISSEKLSNPHQVEDYLSSFNEFSKELLERIVNLTDQNGNTALHYSVSHGNFELVSLLLDTGVCDVNLGNRAGYTAIMLASLANVQTEIERDVVQRLFESGNVNAHASHAGQTALMLAVSHGKTDMVQLLLKCHADVNIQDDDGSTALMCAAEHGHSEIVKILLAVPDVDTTLVDTDGSNALTIAMEAGNRDIGVLLYAHLTFKTQALKRLKLPTTNSPTPPNATER